MSDRRFDKPRTDARKPDGEHRNFNRKPDGERRSFDRKPDGERRSFDRKPDSERRPYDRRPDGERRSYDRKPDGERRSFDRKPDGERRSYDRKPDGERRSFDRKPDGERRSYDRKPDGERRTYDRKPDGERRTYDRKPDGERRTFDRKPAAPIKPDMDARKLALNALCDVTMGGAYANIALDKRLREANISPEDKRLREANISPEDKRLATNIFYTALENRMYIDYLLAQFIDHMPDEQIVRELLHIAAAQILYMDRVPDYAAVDEAVSQIKKFGREKYAPMMNGALRNLIRARDAGELKAPDRAANPVRYLAIMHSLPETMVARLIDDYGEETAEEIISFRPAERWETIRPNLHMIGDADFERHMTERDWHYVNGSVPHSYHVLNAGDLPSDPDYRRGLFSIQSESSMLAAMAVGARPGMNIIDACAAPGGKTALMAEMMQDTGRVYAYELHEHRVELIKKNAERLRLYNIRPVCADATVLRPENEGVMDAVLLDAPCSGLGVMMNKPDLKYRLKDENIAELADIQRRLLDTCCRYVRPGGTLVYSTCTLLGAENRDQVQAFLEQHDEFELDADPSWVPAKLLPHFENGMMQLLAHRDRGMDGFFIAKMRRVK